MEVQVRVEQVSSIPLAVVRRRATVQELSKVVPEACGAVWNLIRAHNVPGAGRHVALYLDEQISLEVGVELAAPMRAAVDGLIASALPAGTVATATHVGPYAGLGAAHTAIRSRCARNGHALAGPNWEIYGHWRDEWNDHPSKIVTDVYYLLK